MTLGLWTIPFSSPFLDALAAHWLAQHGAETLSEGLILVPTRRAARGLGEAFLRATDGRPMLLPRIAAIGAPDEAPLLLGPDPLDLPPAMAEAERLSTLCQLILALEQAGGGPPTNLDAAWRLARELASLMDEAARAEVDLGQALAASVPDDLALHWQKTLAFLAIATEQWPRILDERGLTDPVARQVQLLHALAARWEAAPPAHPIWIAGLTAARPAIIRLAHVVARMPQGAVLFQGLDQDMPDEAWATLRPGHPQMALQRLLAGIGAGRGDVTRLAAAPPPTPREALLCRALLPAEALDLWRTAREEDAAALSGLYLLPAADQQQEALAIAILLRDVLERPGARGVLVTPDRRLAARVVAELGRFGVIADDSAGETLAETPHAILIRLIARAVAEQLAPVPLLALLKHPFAACGLSPGACRAAARQLERFCLRGQRPAPGLTGLRQAIDFARHPPPAGVSDLLDRIEAALAPLLRLATGYAVQPPATLLEGLIAAAESIATTDITPGAERLWSGEEGEMLARVLADLTPALAPLPDMPPAGLPSLFDALLEGKLVNSRRALRGRTETEVLHPRIFIWGLLEARLQTADVVVLGGLVEGVWPPAPDPGPWLSRPMRAAGGLPSPEEMIGQAAHDFLGAASAGGTIILTHPRRLDGAPAVPARWLKRLEAMLAGQSRALPIHPALGWSERVDQPTTAPIPASPPAPRPPRALRPRRLSITEIQVWLADPYAIYARHILRLRELDPLDQPTDAADFGRLVHAGMQIFLTEAGADWGPASAERLHRAMTRALGEARLRPALARWWQPRLTRIADWIAEVEDERRPGLTLTAIGTELPGEWEIAAPGGPFLLTGRADRIERRADGTLGIIDYKTGKPPSPKDVSTGHATQLPLEAAMAERGGFGPDFTGNAAELSYWWLRGAGEPGKIDTPVKEEDARDALIADAAQALATLIATFDDPAKAYLSRPHPGRATRESAYGRLARVAEWAGSVEEG